MCLISAIALYGLTTMKGHVGEILDSFADG